MTAEPPIINSYQATATIDGWVQVDYNISLGSLESSPDVQSGVIKQSGNDGISMNPPEAIEHNVPQGTGRRGFDPFNSTVGISDFVEKSALWNDETISENSGWGSLFKTLCASFF